MKIFTSYALFTFTAALALAACDGSSSGTGGAGGTGSSSSSGSSSSGDGGAGGAGGAAPYPAFMPTVPLAETYGGPVLAKPKFVPVFFPSSLSTEASLTDFMKKYTASSYWAQHTAEYGVGAATIAPSIHVAQDTPAVMTDEELKTFIADQIAADPAWGTPDDNTVYYLFLPGTTKLTYGTSTICETGLGYHDVAPLPSGKNVVYGVTGTCLDTDSTTIVITHELIEAATDPLTILGTPAYDGVTDGYFEWGVVAGPELADLCSRPTGDAAGFTVKPGDLGYVLHRSWSNAAAKGYHDPCLPAPMEPYFNSAPVLPAATVLGKSVHAVTIPVGSSGTIDVQLFSDAPTSGEWTVAGVDLTELSGLGPAKKLSFAFDKDHGKNGDTLKMTITNAVASPTGAGTFYIVSTLGSRSTVWIGAVLD